MASGDILHQRRGLIQYVLLDAVAATSDGVWVDTDAYGDGSITVSGITTATLQLRGSDAEDAPANSTHGVQIGTDITVDGSYDLQRASRWIKIRVTAWTAGTITVNATLRRAGNPVGAA